jgi:hypothetical protein
MCKSLKLVSFSLLDNHIKPFFSKNYNGELISFGLFANIGLLGFNKFLLKVAYECFISFLLKF